METNLDAIRFAFSPNVILFQPALYQTLQQTHEPSKKGLVPLSALLNVLFCFLLLISEKQC